MEVCSPTGRIRDRGLTASRKPWMLGVKTGYWTWGALWIPRSTSVWSAICTEEPNTWGIESLATQQTCYSLHFPLKVVLDRKSNAGDWNRVDKIFMVKADVGPTNGEFPLGLCRPGKENNKWLSPSVPLVLRRRITCGTHFEETKLVASITGRPDPESMSISWIFTPVGRISWGTMRLKQLEQALMGGRTCRWEQSRLPF